MRTLRGYVGSQMGLVEDLRRLGVVSGSVLMVHASMRKVGGDASELVAAIDEAVGQDGTWMMTLGAEDRYAWVNARPEGERAQLLDGTPVFDKDVARAETDN